MKTNSNYTNGEFGFCRSCYDHLAGKVAVDLVEALNKQKIISLKGDKFTISPGGKKWFEDIGINLDEVKKGKRKFGVTCTDRTEKKEHLGGSLGAAVLSQFEKNKWIQKKSNSRIVELTDKGISQLKKFGITLQN